MIPKKVTLENFLSFGKRTEIVFGDDEPLWVLGGANGVGKSAVFDAMTYCLFGHHRGGGKEIDPLVRHGTNGFSVTFEFEFSGVDYRVTRNRSGSRTTQSVEARNPSGSWGRVPNINNVTEVKSWAEKTLGLGFEAFKASVLLRQGEADAIVTAGGAERLKILKKIIGAERYEELSDRVHNATLKMKARLDDLRDRRAAMPDITADQVTEANAAFVDAEKSKLAAAVQVQTCFERLAHAKTWEIQVPTRENLIRQIRQADERLAIADQIRTEHSRYLELQTVLPLLRDLDTLERRLATGEPQLESLRQIRDDAQRLRSDLAENLEHAKASIATAHDVLARHTLRITNLESERTRSVQFLKSAQELADLDRQFLELPQSLDLDFTQIVQELRSATTAQLESRDRASRLQVLRQEAANRQQQFDSLEVGVTCSACGQQVTAEHAERERSEAAAVLRDLDDQSHLAESELATSVQVVAAAQKQFENLDRQIKIRDRLCDQLADRRRNLESLGVSANLDTLTATHATLVCQIATLQAEAATSRDDLERHTRDQQTWMSQLRDVEKQFQESSAAFDLAQQAVNEDRVRSDILRRQLPATWIDEPNRDLDSLSAEWEQLGTSQIVERFRQLEQDTVLRDSWQTQLVQIDDQLSAIPDEARVSVRDAEESHRLAKRDSQTAEDSWQSARDRVQELGRQLADLDAIRTSLAAAERECDLHGKLDYLIGKRGLQRELVRDAETQIVRRADETVRKLSDGDLSIELDRSEDTDEEAMRLLVRRADSATPIPVGYLSGSQKFRVAVSIALAIGRFAAGHARPLESVIIDEGFGSLDRDGLRSAAQELSRLKQELRRIILVSHQDEFTDHFPVVIRLLPGESGTTVETIRR